MNQCLRLNVMNVDAPGNKISIIVPSNTSISRLKRIIEQQIFQLHEISMIVGSVEDSNGFILSNNSNIGDHVQSNHTIYIHNDQLNRKMSLGNNISDICLTLRYVSANVLDQLLVLQVDNLAEVLQEIIHVAFWNSNIAVVEKLFKFMNKALGGTSKSGLEHKQQLGMMVVRVFSYWLVDTPNSISTYPQLCYQLLEIMQKLINMPLYASIIKNSPLSKALLVISKNESIAPAFKKIALKIIKAINGKKQQISHTQSAYIPTIFNDSQDIQSILEMLNSTNDDRVAALDYLLADNMLMEACVRFDYYYKLTNIFTIKNIKGKGVAHKWSKVMQTITNNTTKQKSIEIMQKDILKKIHNFLLEAPVEVHPYAIQYCQKISSDSTSVGMFNIELATDLIYTPYLQLQKILLQSISEMSDPDKKISAIRFIPSIKDLIRVSLKSDDNEIIRDSLKAIANLCLDEQCRYQILNLKGIELLVKYLQSSRNNLVERVCAKGLLNLSISSKQNKVRVLAAMSAIIEKYYRAQYDNITLGFIETLMKSPNI